MKTDPTPPVSRVVVRAVLEARDHRHNETHAILLAMYQALVAELVEQGSLAPGPLAERLRRGHPAVAPDPHGAPARDMLTRVVGWLETMQVGLPPSHPERWHAPAPPNDE